jgi:hypothetical protein
MIDIMSEFNISTGVLYKILGNRRRERGCNKTYIRLPIKERNKKHREILFQFISKLPKDKKTIILDEASQMPDIIVDIGKEKVGIEIERRKSGVWVKTKNYEKNGMIIGLDRVIIIGPKDVVEIKDKKATRWKEYGLNNIEYVVNNFL